ncbi:invasion associated locus B family protein [Rhizobium sp. SAFR-030]|uniref:invasion associated locus B family protein n=1 Tax=Rhizobium sp. SAFR-030 TaxID=3387277 RepID=UPI003F7FB1FB
MRRLRFLLACLSAFVCLPLLSVPPVGAAQLPGGVGELLETYGDWTVGCRAQNAVVGCVVSQVQSDPKSRRPRLSVEFATSTGGRIEGALLLPFGLALANGVAISLDDAGNAQSFPFSTCLPGGCLVPIRFDAAMTEALKKGTLLHISAVMLSTGATVPMRVSLKGLPEAMQRASELAP